MPLEEVGLVRRQVDDTPHCDHFREPQQIGHEDLHYYFNLATDQRHSLQNQPSHGHLVIRSLAAVVMPEKPQAHSGCRKPKGANYIAECNASGAHKIKQTSRKYSGAHLQTSVSEKCWLASG